MNSYERLQGEEDKLFDALCSVVPERLNEEFQNVLSEYVEIQLKLEGLSNE